MTPTMIPSQSPTTNPVLFPTNAPILDPTNSPSINPTINPTMRPCEYAVHACVLYVCAMTKKKIALFVLFLYQCVIGFIQHVQHI